MLTYQYECLACGHQFVQRQAMTDAPLETCPKCGGNVRRIVTGGSGFVFKEGGTGRIGSKAVEGCSFEQHGTTCCGMNEPCSKSCGLK